MTQNVYEKLNRDENNKDYIDYFYKIEKMNKDLMDEFYGSTIEIIKGMGVLFPKEEFWEDENLAYNEIFITPDKIFQRLKSEYSFYILSNVFYENNHSRVDIIKELKKDYDEFIKEYIALVYLKGFQEVYKNYIEILKSSNILVKSIMKPLNELINIYEYEKNFNSLEDFKLNERNIVQGIQDLNALDFQEFYNSSIDSQRKIVFKMEKFINYVESYYEEIFNYIISGTSRADYDYRLIEKKLDNKNFTEYNNFLKLRTVFYLEKYIKEKKYNDIVLNSKEEIKNFLKGQKNPSVDNLKDEIKRLEEKIKKLEKESYD